VLIVHLSQLLGNDAEVFRGGAGWIIPQSQELLNQGARGVQLFFILSAYSLCLTNGRHREFDKPWVSFFLARVFRLYPMWIFANLIHFLIYRNGSLFQSLTFVFGLNRYETPNPEIIIGSWSLFAEICFYISFPFLIKLANYPKILVLVFLISILARPIWIKAALNIGISDDNSFIGLFPLSNFYAFVAGILIFVLQDRSSGYRFFKISRPKMLEMLLFGWLVVNLFTGVDQLYIVLYLIAFLSLFLGTNHSTNRFYSLLSKPLIVLGKYSYTIYLFEFLALDLLIRYLPVETFANFPIDVQLILFLPAYLLTVWVIGFVGYRFIEIPGIRLGKRISNVILSRN
jgi:peptidoglycan/LPS O-acetylase OafA/YrhL